MIQCSCLLSSLLTVLHVLYAIIQLSSVQISDPGFFSFATLFLQMYLFSSECKDISKLSISVNTSNIFHPSESNTLSFLFSLTRQHNKRCLFLALRDTFCKNMTNHKARKKLANQKWIHKSVYPCGISEQAFGSRFADRLCYGFCDMSGCNTGYPSKDNCLMLWSTWSMMASDLEKKDLIPSFRVKLKILQDN